MNLVPTARRVRRYIEGRAMGRAWNRYSNLGSMSIFNVLIRPIQDKGRSVRSSVNFLSFWSKGLKFREYMSEVCLGIAVPK